MNLKEYISSGIVESYVLGLATEAERDEFEAMCSQHPEIAEARNTFELALEAQLLTTPLQPPVHLKAKIQESLTASDAATVADDEYVSQAPVRRLNIWKLMAAASLLLLAGAVFWAVNVNNKYKQVQQANRELIRANEETTARLTALQTDADILQKPGIKVAAMQGTETAPQALATVFWDSTAKDVYLLINNMPQPATGKQYQLWALLDNQPIDLGMIEVAQKRLLYRMKNVQNAQAFAVTLEPKGGSIAPTGAMYVVGKL